MNRRRDELAPPGLSAGALTDRVSATVLGTRPPRAWWLALGLATLLSLLFLVGVVYVLSVGVGAFGLNIPVAWGFPIINTIFLYENYSSLSNFVCESKRSLFSDSFGWRPI